ncbi:MAG: NifU family protein [Kiritimatiellia bacterium]
MKERVEQVLDRIRPSLQAEGGDIELVDIKDGVVLVRLRGACAGCPMSQITMTQGVERIVKQMLPEVKRVEAVV